MKKHSINHNTANDGNMLLSAVVIERQKDGNILIVNWSEEFQPAMNGVHPNDNFDNTDIIPEKVGCYTFDVTLNGGKDFNGEYTEYWSEFLLHNCR